jgi:hypothetical protein
MGKALWKTRQVAYFLLFGDSDKTKKKIETLDFALKCAEINEIFIR